VLPCMLGFALGWLVWDRWLAQAATILIWGVFLLPFMVLATTFGSPVRDAGFWLPVGGLFVISVLLTELGLRGRDGYQRYLRRRFPDIANPS
jgi:hypothetical protein